MSTPHTPVPWKTGAKYQTRIIIEGRIIAMTALPDDEGFASAEDKANAARIVACVNACEGIADPSAVPELLAALTRLLRAFESDAEQVPSLDALTCWQTNSQAVSQARAAIANAEGAQ